MSFDSYTMYIQFDYLNQMQSKQLHSGQSLQMECKHETVASVAVVFFLDENCCGCDPRLLYRFSHNGHVPCTVSFNSMV